MAGVGLSGPEIPDCVVELDRNLSTLTPEAVVIETFTTILQENASHAPHLSSLLLRHLCRSASQNANSATPVCPTPLSLLYLLDSIVKHRSVGPIYQLALLKSKPPSSPTLKDSFLMTVRSIRPEDIPSRLRVVRILKTWGGIFGPQFVHEVDGAIRSGVFEEPILRYREKVKRDQKLYFVNRRFFMESPAVCARVRNWEVQKEREREQEMQQRQQQRAMMAAAAYSPPPPPLRPPPPGVGMPMSMPVPMMSMHHQMQRQQQPPPPQPAASSVPHPYRDPFGFMQQRHRPPTTTTSSTSAPSSSSSSAEEELKNLWKELESHVGGKYERILRSLYGQRSGSAGSGSGSAIDDLLSSVVSFVQKCPKCGLRLYSALELDRHLEVHEVVDMGDGGGGSGGEIAGGGGGLMVKFSRKWMPSTAEWIGNRQNNRKNVVFENAGEAMFRLVDEVQQQQQQQKQQQQQQQKKKKKKRVVGESAAAMEMGHDVEEFEGRETVTASTSAIAATASQQQKKTSLVKYDREHSRCPICNEEFVRVFDDKKQEWMFVDAVEETIASLNMKMIVHTGSCHSALSVSKNLDMLVSGASQRESDADSDTDALLLIELDSPMTPLPEEEKEEEQERPLPVVVAVEPRKRKLDQLVGEAPEEPPRKKVKLVVTTEDGESSSSVAAPKPAAAEDGEEMVEEEEEEGEKDENS